MPPDGRSVDDFAFADPTITRGHYSSPKDPKGDHKKKTFFWSTRYGSRMVFELWRYLTELWGLLASWGFFFCMNQLFDSSSSIANFFFNSILTKFTVCISCNVSVQGSVTLWMSEEIVTGDEDKSIDNAGMLPITWNFISTFTCAGRYWFYFFSLSSLFLLSFFFSSTLSLLSLSLSLLSLSYLSLSLFSLSYLSLISLLSLSYLSYLSLSLSLSLSLAHAQSNTWRRTLY